MTKPTPPEIKQARKDAANRRAEMRLYKITYKIYITRTKSFTLVWAKDMQLALIKFYAMTPSQAKPEKITFTGIIK